VAAMQIKRAEGVEKRLKATPHRRPAQSEGPCLCGAMHGASRPLASARGDNVVARERLFQPSRRAGISRAVVTALNRQSIPATINSVKPSGDSGGARPPMSGTPPKRASMSKA
jgi:hypothetical protein